MVSRDSRGRPCHQQGRRTAIAVGGGSTSLVLFAASLVGRRLSVWLCIGLVAGLIGAGRTWAQGTSGIYELWTGIQTTTHATSVYAGTTYAPFGVLSDDGVRLRAVAGIGRYSYTTLAYASAVGTDMREARSRGISGESAFGDLLAGYQVRIGAMTMKAFAGIAFSEHHLSPSDRGNRVSGEEIGFKAILEGWFNLSDRSWASMDLAYSTAHGEFSSRARLGYKLTTPLSIGPELGAFGNEEFRGGRGGLFIRYAWGNKSWARDIWDGDVLVSDGQDDYILAVQAQKQGVWGKGEVSLSGGISGDIEKPTNPYVMVNVSQQF